MFKPDEFNKLVAEIKSHTYTPTKGELSLEKGKLNSENIKELMDALVENAKLPPTDKGRISSLDLSLNEIDHSGAKIIAQSLCYIPQVKHLYLVNNKIDNEGMLAFASVIEKNETLETLDLSNNKVTIAYNIPFKETCYGLLAKAISLNTYLKKINLSNIWSQSDVSWEIAEVILANNKTLAEIKIRSDQPSKGNSGHNILNYLKDNTSLCDLDINHFKLSHEHFKIAKILTINTLSAEIKSLLNQAEVTEDLSKAIELYKKSKEKLFELELEKVHCPDLASAIDVSMAKKSIQAGQLQECWRILGPLSSQDKDIYLPIAEAFIVNPDALAPFRAEPKRFYQFILCLLKDSPRSNLPILINLRKRLIVTALKGLKESKYNVTGISSLEEYIGKKDVISFNELAEIAGNSSQPYDSAVVNTWLMDEKVKNNLSNKFGTDQLTVFELLLDSDKPLQLQSELFSIVDTYFETLDNTKLDQLYKEFEASMATGDINKLTKYLSRHDIDEERDYLLDKLKIILEDFLKGENKYPITIIEMAFIKLGDWVFFEKKFQDSFDKLKSKLLNDFLNSNCDNRGYLESFKQMFRRFNRESDLNELLLKHKKGIDAQLETYFKFGSAMDLNDKTIHIFPTLRAEYKIIGFEKEFEEKVSHFKDTIKNSFLIGNETLTKFVAHYQSLGANLSESYQVIFDEAIKNINNFISKQSTVLATFQSIFDDSKYGLARAAKLLQLLQDHRLQTKEKITILYAFFQDDKNIFLQKEVQGKMVGAMTDGKEPNIPLITFKESLKSEVKHLLESEFTADDAEDRLNIIISELSKNLSQQHTVLATTIDQLKNFFRESASPAQKLIQD